MSFAYETVLAVLSAVGIVALVWWTVGWLMRPKGKGPVYILAFPQNVGELENAAHETVWLRQWGADVRLCVITDRMDSDGMSLVQSLAKKDAAHAACRLEELVFHDGRSGGGSNSFGYLWQ